MATIELDHVLPLNALASLYCAFTKEADLRLRKSTEASMTIEACDYARRQRCVVQCRVLARRRATHGVLQRRRLAPFLGRPRAAVSADLGNAPAQFEVMAGGS